MRTERSYDNLDRLTNQTTRRDSDNAVLAKYDYTLNLLNQRTSMANEDGAYWNYAYDGLGQVTSGTKKLSDHTPINGFDYGYAYDGIGNRTTATVNGRTQNYTTNELNQYTQRTVPADYEVVGVTGTWGVEVNGNAASRQGRYFHAPLTIDNSASAQWTKRRINDDNAGTWDLPYLYTPKNPEQFTYDLDGNLLSDGRWIYTWDGENRLASMETFTTVPTGARKKLEFKYDYMSRRVAKIVSSWNASSSSWNAPATTRFVYDGWNIVGESRMGRMNGDYVWGLDLSGTLQGAGGVGGFLNYGTQLYGSTASYNYAVSDGNGNVSKLFSMYSGGVFEREYGPFGETITMTPWDGSYDVPFNPPIGFSSKYEDAESGMLYYGYRYYNPTAVKYGDVHGCPSGMKLLASPVRLARIRYHYLKEKIVTMSEMPPCPKCQSPYVYEDGPLLICPECAHEWAKDSAGADGPEGGSGLVVRDANGNQLADGDSVTLIKDLKLKGASSVIKMGTKVKNIRLVESDHNIDCKIPGVGAIGLKSEFVKKASD